MVSSLTKRLVMGLVLLLIVVIGGAIGYYLIGGGRWQFGDCIYMTVITVTTVGYGEGPERHGPRRVRARIHGDPARVRHRQHRVLRVDGHGLHHRRRSAQRAVRLAAEENG